MRGVITGLKGHNSSFYFITGENGIQYYSRPGFLAAKKAAGNKVWDKFVWNGNGCEFDPVPDESGRTPVAMNVIPNFIIDPDYERRKARRNEQRRREKANAEIREIRKKKSALMKAEAERIAEVHNKYKTYIVQYRMADEWIAVEIGGMEMAYDTSKEAKSRVEWLESVYPNIRFRVRNRWKELKKRGKEESN